MVHHEEDPATLLRHARLSCLGLMSTLVFLVGVLLQVLNWAASLTLPAVPVLVLSFILWLLFGALTVREQALHPEI